MAAQGEVAELEIQLLSYFPCSKLLNQIHGEGWVKPTYSFRNKANNITHKSIIPFANNRRTKCCNFRKALKLNMLNLNLENLIKI